jgi:hypothetical protein
MEPQQNESTANDSESKVNPESSGTKHKKIVTKKIVKGTKPASGKTKVVKKVAKTKKLVSVKNSENQELSQNQNLNQIQSQIQSQNPNQNVLPPKMQRQVLPNQVYQKELPVQNREDQINKQYQLKDIVHKSQTMVNYLKALSTTVVKPVIVQEVTTRKPIIAPVDIKTPVNFFEGQPLNEEDLIIQNFFKDTTPVQYTNSDYSNLFNGNNYLSQSMQYPSMESQQEFNNANYLSQSMQYSSPTQTYFKSNTIASTSLSRPLAEKVQLKNVSGEEFNQPHKKVIKKKGKIVKKKKKKITKSQNVAVNQENAEANIAGKNQELSTAEKGQNINQSVPVEQKKIVEQNAEEEDDDDKMPRDSVRDK